MAELPCAVPLSKKHIYEGLLSSPAPTKRNESAFSFRIDDYREIFSPSKASLGLSIPTLDLPAVDQTDTSTVDYAGVFGGVGDDHRVEEELFRKSKRKSKRDSQPSRSSTQTKITDTKSRDLSCNFGNDQASTSPEKTEIPPSKSEEFCASSKNIQASSSVSSRQPCDAVKDFDDSNDKTNQLSKDDIDGTANIAGLHTVPEYTHRIDEVGPMSEAGLVMDKCMSTDGNDKQANDHDAGLQKEFDRDKCDSFDASHSTREANCEPQTYSASTLSSPPKLYSSSNEYFRRSSSLRSKSSKNNQRSSAAADSPPLLDEELDVNSAAAVSAAAMKRAIEEAKAKIRSAKEILKGKEMDGSGRLSFKNSFKFNATSSETNHSYAACGLKPNDSSNVEATMQNESVNEDKVVEQKDDLKTKATADGQLEDEGGVAMKKHVVHRSTCAPETFIETHESSHPPEYVNDAELETSRKHEGVGEWEATNVTKHLSQLFTGVKNRFVSFISKQADAEKTVLQEDDPSGSGSSEQSERSTYQVQDADAHISAADQDQLENDVEMNGFVSSEVGESAQDSNRVSLEIHKLEEIVEEVTVSSDVKVPSTGQSNLSEPEEESNKVEVQESVEVKQQDEKGQMDNSELEQHDMNLDTTYQTRKYDPEVRNCEENNEEEEQLQDQGVVEEEVYESFDDEDEIWRQEEGYSCNETEMPENCEKKLQDIEMAEDTHKERVQASTKEYSESFDFQDVKGKATVGPIDVVDDTSEQDDVYEHDADNAHEHVVCADNVCEHDESLLLSKSKEACLHVERSPNAQLVESSSEAEGRMTNLATSPIEHKVNDEHPVIEPKVNYEKPVIEPKVNDEQPKIETKVNDEQPIIEPKLNDEQPVIEPKLTDKQPIIEPKVNDEQPSIETKVNDDEQPNTEPKMKDEQLIIEPKVNDEQGIINRKFNDEQSIIVPKVTDEQQIIEPKVHDAKSIIEPRVFDEQPNIETGVTDEQPVIEPKVNDEQPIIESKMNDEQPVIEPKVNDEQPIIEPKLNDEQPIIEFKVNDEQPILEPKMPITEPKVTHEQPITEPKAIIEPKVNDEQLITEPKVNHEQPIIEAKVNDEQPTVEPLVNDEQPTIKPNVNAEQPICPEVANQLVKEDIVEQPRCSFEVVDNFLEQDHYFHAVDNLSEQDEKSSLSRNGASGYDDGNQYSQDVDFTSKNERMAESISTTSETKGNLEQPGFIHTINELIGKEMLEPTGCSIEVANETLDHNECPPRADYACMLEDDSYLDGKSEDYGHNDRNNCDHNVEFCFEDDTSKPEWNVEQPSCVQNMTGTTAAAGDSVEIEEEIEDTHEVLSHTNILKVQQETDLNFEQKHVDEETFTTDIGLENQVDESLFRTDMGEVYMASDQDKTMSGVETSNKRKRWFEKDEMRELYQCDILLGDEINYEGVEIHVSESGECTNARQDDSCSGLEDGYSTEPTQRRRRWFQDRGEEVIHKPSVYYVAEMTTDMDEIAQESEIDKTLQDRVHSLVNDNVANDQAESTSNAEAAPRRRRWFEYRQKSGPAQRPSILVDNVTNADRGDIEQGVDAAIHDEAGKKAATGVISDRVTQKEKERKVVDRAIRAARLRAFVEARERAAVEVRQKAAATAQDQQGKASSEIKTGSDRASMDAKLKVERAAVERATAEARERALQKAMSEKAAYERDPINQTSGPSCSKGYSSAPYAAGKSSGATSESPRRRKAMSERNRRTRERAAKVLEEKNLRDSLAQNEQAERDMFADILDGEVKRWLIGKDGNLRSLLSTLQYILGPDSGWQPIPLSDLIDPTSVRKAYKRAALCVHPDKLQQRGATIQQKYICEKVFDVLKDAWKWHELIPDDI